MKGRQTACKNVQKLALRSEKEKKRKKTQSVFVMRLALVTLYG